MSDYWTWGQIKAKVEQDLDLEEETFIQPDEMLGYANEAIREAEAEIHGLYEDYFLKRSTISLVSGQEEYDIPTDIYAHKIRRLVYQNGTTIYEVKKLRDWKKFELLAEGQSQSPNTVQFYMLHNSNPGAPQMLLTPTPDENGPYLKLWYLREANKLAVESDICDIPEFINFVLAFIKLRCNEKDQNAGNIQNSLATVDFERKTMLTTLANMIPDANNQIEGDFSHYLEHS